MPFADFCAHTADLSIRRAPRCRGARNTDLPESGRELSLNNRTIYLRNRTPDFAVWCQLIRSVGLI
jgi:hypothetical protein